MNNKILKIKTDFEVIYPHQNKIDACETKIQTLLDDIACISKLHPRYEALKKEIEVLEKRIIQLKTQ